jgi:ribosomal protein S18 acetylase RimI-like enzyme
MNKAVQISEMQNKDVNKVIALALQSPHLQDHDGPPEFLSPEIIKGYIKSPHDIVLTAKASQTLIGFSITQYNPYSKVAYLEDILVIPEYQARGIGSQLYHHTVSTLKSRDCIDIWALVHTENQQMVEFLQKKGYHKGRKFYLMDKIPL